MLDSISRSRSTEYLKGKSNSISPDLVMPSCDDSHRSPTITAHVKEEDMDCPVSRDLRALEERNRSTMGDSSSLHKPLKVSKELALPFEDVSLGGKHVPCEMKFDFFGSEPSLGTFAGLDGSDDRGHSSESITLVSAKLVRSLGDLAEAARLKPLRVAVD